VKKLVVLFLLVSILSSLLATSVSADSNIIPSMTSYTAPSGKVSASHELAGFPAYRAFDNVFNTNNNDNDWSATTNVNVWIQYEFPVAKRVTSYTLKATFQAPTSPNTWKFQGSNDGVNFTDLDSRSGVLWNANEKKEFPVVNTSTFTHYRLFIVSNNGHQWTQIQQIQMSDSEPIPGTINDLIAVGGTAVVDLSWSSVASATSYVIKRSETQGGPYTTIASGVTSTTYHDTSVVNRTTYYYVVIAVNSGGESGASNEAAATPEAPSRALLTIYLTNGQVKEYDLSSAELESFMTWYDTRAAGSGPARYAFTKNWNKGPFKVRKEYVVFDKIVNFDVDEYDLIEE